MAGFRARVSAAVMGFALLCHAVCLVRAQGAASLCPQLPTAAVCAAMSKCQWNEFVNECTATCDAEAYSYDQQACEANPSCSWVYGQCMPSCPMLASSTTCNNGMMCAWDATRNTCVTNCTLSRMGLPESQCRFFPMCKTFVDPRTHRPHCIPGCRSFLGEASCKQHPQDCLWNASDRVCVPPPAPTPAPTPNPTAAPYNPRLPGECHHRATDPASCAAAQCVWNPFLMMCSQPCYLPFANESTCLSNPSCSWFSGSCARRCDIIGDETTCLSGVSQCEWNGTTCVFYCGDGTIACDTYSECRFGPDNSCVKSCRSHPDPTRCAQDPICRWDAATLTCFEIPTPNPPPVPPPPPPPPAPPGSCPSSCEGPSDCTETCPDCLHYPNQGIRCYPSSAFAAGRAKHGDAVFRVAGGRPDRGSHGVRRV